jgi:carbonic anhydrase
MRIFPLLVLPACLLAQAQERDVKCATGTDCWNILAAGNVRWQTASRLEHPDQALIRRREFASLPLRKQKPFAAIVSCSDSRVPPEVVFDRGLGDLFIVRVAGNVVDGFALASIQYAVKVLDVKLVVVLGHQDCGAAKAACDIGPRLCGTDVGKPLPEPLLSLVNAILPAKDEVFRRKWPLTLDTVTDANVYLTIPKIKNVVNEDTVVLGKRYNLDGRVIALRQ